MHRPVTGLDNGQTHFLQNLGVDRPQRRLIVNEKNGLARRRSAKFCFHRDRLPATRLTFEARQLKHDGRAATNL